MDVLRRLSAVESKIQQLADILQVWPADIERIDAILEDHVETSDGDRDRIKALERQIDNLADRLADVEWRIRG